MFNQLSYSLAYGVQSKSSVIENRFTHQSQVFVTKPIILSPGLKVSRNLLFVNMQLFSKTTFDTSKNKMIVPKLPLFLPRSKRSEQRTQSLKISALLGAIVFSKNRQKSFSIFPLSAKAMIAKGNNAVALLILFRDANCNIEFFMRLNKSQHKSTEF